MIKRQTITMVICGVLAVILAVVYFTVISPMLVPENIEEKPIELLFDLEVRADDPTRVYMFAPIERARMTKIEVHNDKGGYTFIKRRDTFYIENMEEAPYDLTALSYLVTTTGSSVASRRILIDDKTDLSAYGLAASDDPAYYVITTDTGVTHKVWIGDQIPTGGGYYCQYDGRPAVYIIGPNIGLTVFAKVYDLITPTLGLAVEQQSYNYVDYVGLIKHGNPLVEIETVTPKENGTENTSSPKYTYEFTYTNLKSFTPNSTMRNYIIETMSGLAGNETVAVGDEITTENLKSKYGIDIESPFFGVYYTYEEPAYIYFSAPDEEGMSYAYSTVYDIVVKIRLGFVPLYNLEIHDLIQNNIINTSINLASKVEIKGSLSDEDITVDSVYSLKATAVPDSQRYDITVTNDKTGEVYTEEDGVDNFKSLYMDMVRLYIEGEVDIKNIDSAEHIATVTLTETDGTSKRYDFYAYNNTRCYFTVNGALDGNYVFYINRDNVEMLIRDTHYFDNDITIDSVI